MKRVWAYYRVSTKSQVLHHDTTLQQKACLNYIFNFNDWELKREIEELAVSGYSVKLEDRKGINRILLAAKQKEFEVLLVFMLDRIGRKEEEMKYLFNALQKEGIEIWSVTEGMVSFFSEREAEYYLQCSTEVEKTSQRVKRRFEQLNEEGTFTGGSPAFGYQIIKLDGKSELAIYPKEAEVVKKIFYLAANNQFGCSKISQKLNQDGINTRNGKQWIYSTISSILRNPIYIGQPAYNKCSNLLGKHKRSEWKLQPKKDKLVIVNNEEFFKTQELMDKRNPYENHSSITISINFLLSDLIYCGYCDKKLKAENNRNRPKIINGISFDTKIYRRYVCDHAKNKHEIHDQRDFGADKHEELIISMLIEVMNEGTFSIDDKKIKQEKESCLCEIDKVKQDLNHLYSAYFQLKNENQLQKLAKLEKESLEFNKKLFHKEATLNELITEAKSIELLLKELPNWNRNYVAYSETAKKEMLGRIIKKIILKKGECEVIMKDYVANPVKISHQIKK